jgi:3-oxosteroid 1-dehydrogenase
MTKSTKPDWSIPKSWFATGFVAKADTISELAKKMDIDPQGLQETIEKMNRYAKTGVDEDFHRGESDYDRYYADPEVKPNPCLAPIDEGPYYAMRSDAGDFGTAGGLVTNTDAQVLNQSGDVIEGLFAIGNCSAPILSTYPGPGATLGPAMTMGYQAAKKITGYQD